MRYCKDCWNFDGCNVKRRTVEFAVDDGVCLNFDGKPMTNADRIRAMSDEDLAGWLCGLFIANTCVTHCPGYDFCYGPYGKSNGLKKWLQQPAEGE